MKYLLYNLITYQCYRKGIHIMFSILPSRHIILYLSSSDNWNPSLKHQICGSACPVLKCKYKHTLPGCTLPITKSMTLNPLQPDTWIWAFPCASTVQQLALSCKEIRRKLLKMQVTSPYMGLHPQIRYFCRKQTAFYQDTLLFTELWYGYNIFSSRPLSHWASISLQKHSDIVVTDYFSKNISSILVPDDMPMSSKPSTAVPIYLAISSSAN